MVKRIRYFCINDIIAYFGVRRVLRKEGRMKAIKYLYKSRRPWSLKDAIDEVKRLDNEIPQ